MQQSNIVLFFLLFFTIFEGWATNIDTLAVQLQLDSLNKMDYSEKAFTWAEQLVDEANANNNSKKVAILKNWLGDAYTKVGTYEKALEHLQTAHQIAVELQEKKIQATAELRMGRTFFRLQEFEKAIEFTEQGIRQFQILKDNRSIADGQNNLAIIYMSMGKPRKALEQIIPARNFFLQENDMARIQSCTQNMAIAYVQTGRFEEALPLFEEGLVYSKSQKDTFEFAADYGNLAYAYQNIGDYEQAFAHYDSSLYYSNLLGRDEITYVTLQDMTDGYKIKGDYKKALETHQKYHETYLKVINKATKNRIAELEVQFDTERKEKALLESQKEIEVLEQAAQIRQQRLLLLLGGLLASLVIAALIYFKWKAEIKNKEVRQQLMQSELENKALKAEQLEQQLQNKKADLTNLTLDISRKNEFSNQLITKLESLEKSKPKEVKAQLREIIQFTVSHLQINEDLALLQENVDQVNQEFYQKLDTQFGDLTPNEKYLSGLIRLNLSNKDIATIKGISVNSAKMNRYRLRKKLGLTSEVDIVHFLQEL